MAMNNSVRKALLINSIPTVGGRKYLKQQLIGGNESKILTQVTTVRIVRPVVSVINAKVTFKINER